MRMLRLLLSTIIVSVLVFMIMPAHKVLADQDDPDSTPTMVANAYRNLIETGDQLYIFYANIPYSVVPDALVTEALLWSLIDTDGSTILGSSIGTAFNDSGYGYNVYSMYFSASDAPTWGQIYTVRLTGNPTIFDTPPTYDYNLSSGDFSALTDQQAVQDELALRILVIARDLDIRWGLTLATTLINEQETGTVLSSNGETFFRGAIFGLQAMAPGVFQIGVATITAADRTWSTDYADNISSQYAGTFIGTAQTAGADMFSKGYDLVSLMFVGVIVIAIVIGNTLITRNIWSGMIDATLVAILFARIGIPAVLLPFMGLIGGISWMYISGKVWGIWR